MDPILLKFNLQFLLLLIYGLSAVIQVIGCFILIICAIIVIREQIQANHQ